MIEMWKILSKVLDLMEMTIFFQTNEMGQILMKKVCPS